MKTNDAIALAAVIIVVLVMMYLLGQDKKKPCGNNNKNFIKKLIGKKLIVNDYINLYKTYRLLFTIAQCHPRLLPPPPPLSIQPPL